jgi:hypothetical protein
MAGIFEPGAYALQLAGSTSLRAKRSNPLRSKKERVDCFVASAPRNDVAPIFSRRPGLRAGTTMRGVRSPDGAEESCERTTLWRNPGTAAQSKIPGCAIGRRFAPTRWLHPGYGTASSASGLDGYIVALYSLLHKASLDR